MLTDGWYGIYYKPKKITEAVERLLDGTIEQERLEKDTSECEDSFAVLTNIAKITAISSKNSLLVDDIAYMAEVNNNDIENKTSTIENLEGFITDVLKDINCYKISPAHADLIKAWALENLVGDYHVWLYPGHCFVWVEDHTERVMFKLRFSDKILKL